MVCLYQYVSDNVNDGDSSPLLIGISVKTCKTIATLGCSTRIAGIPNLKLQCLVLW